MFELLLLLEGVEEAIGLHHSREFAGEMIRVSDGDPDGPFGRVRDHQWVVMIETMLGGAIVMKAVDE